MGRVAKDLQVVHGRRNLGADAFDHDGTPQTLYLDEKDRPLLDGKRVVLVDDG